MAILIFWLVVLVALGNFADFLLGQTGGRRAKDRLVDFYIVINARNWSGIFRWTGSAIYEFMSKYFGNPSSVRYFVRVLTFSLPASTIVGIYLMIDVRAENYVFGSFSDLLISISNVLLHMLPFWISGYVVDLLSWHFAHRAFAFMSRSQLIGLVLVIFGILMAIYVAMIMSVFLLFTIQFMLFPEVDLEASNIVKNMFVSFLVVTFGLFDKQGEIPNAVAILPVLIPYALFVIILTACAAVACSQSLMQRPFSVIIQRAEESSKGVFTLGATALATLIGILSAAERAFN